MKTGLILKLTTKAGMRDAAVEALSAMIPVAEGEQGTELYILHADAGDENVLWMYELYTDGDALAVHGGSDAMAEVMGKMGEFAEATEMSFLSPIAAAGHPL